MNGRTVAVLLHEPQLGGATGSVLGVVPLLEKLSWRFVFWAPGDGPARRELLERGYEVGGEERPLRYSRRALSEPPGALARLRQTPGYLRRCRAWVSEQAPAVLHANTLLTIPELLASRRGAGGTVLHVHEMLPSDLRGRAAAVLIRRAGGQVIACSTPCAEALRRQKVRAAVVHGGVEPGGLVPLRRDHDRITIGTAGTVSPRKGSDLFVAAAARVSQQRRDVEFRMAGDLAPGPDEAWARSLVESASDAGVRYVGRADMAQELGELDVFVLPSRRDPFPVTVLEAMAAGLPVIGARVDGIAEQLAEDSGVLVHPDDAEALATAIGRLVDSAELRDRLGATARQRVGTNFTLERQAEGLHRAYLAASGTSAPRPG